MNQRRLEVQAAEEKIGGLCHHGMGSESERVFLAFRRRGGKSRRLSETPRDSEGSQAPRHGADRGRAWAGLLQSRRGKKGGHRAKNYTRA